MSSFFLLTVFGVTLFPPNIDYMADIRIRNQQGQELSICGIHFLRGDKYKEIEYSCQEVKDEIIRLSMEYRNGKKKRHPYGYAGEVI